MEKLRIIVGGFIGLLPAGGVTWDYVQYPLGLALMGHDVYYIEDTRLFPIYQEAGSAWDDAGSCVRHLKRVMDYFGLKDRWAYRDEASGQCFGLSEAAIVEICKSADVFINISCSTVMRPEYLQIPCRILIDSDPMFTQIQYTTEQSFTPGQSGLRSLLAGHTHHFTFGENVGGADCQIPTGAISWMPTRQPICLDYWKKGSERRVRSYGFTTLMNWSAGKKLIFQETSWGQKDVEFEKILPIPGLFENISFSVVINQTGQAAASFPRQMIEQRGWQILAPEAVAGDWTAYRAFLAGSQGELSVAKETYVKARTGWFSCRSACYLAAGVPVICQDTGWTKFLPSGNGLFGFSTTEEARNALRTVSESPDQQSKAALRIACEFFDHTKVLSSMLQKL